MAKGAVNRLHDIASHTLVVLIRFLKTVSVTGCLSFTQGQPGTNFPDFHELAVHQGAAYRSRMFFYIGRLLSRSSVIRFDS